MYNLHQEVPWEGSFIRCNGSLEEIIADIRSDPHLSIDDCFLTQDADVSLQDVFQEARNATQPK